MTTYVTTFIFLLLSSLPFVCLISWNVMISRTLDMQSQQLQHIEFTVCVCIYVYVYIYIYIYIYIEREREREREMHIF